MFMCFGMALATWILSQCYISVLLSFSCMYCSNVSTFLIKMATQLTDCTCSKTRSQLHLDKGIVKLVQYVANSHPVSCPDCLGSQEEASKHLWFFWSSLACHILNFVPFRIYFTMNIHNASGKKWFNFIFCWNKLTLWCESHPNDEYESATSV